jgi:hypothetical protein
MGLERSNLLLAALTGRENRALVQAIGDELDMGRKSGSKAAALQVLWICVAVIAALS